MSWWILIFPFPSIFWRPVILRAQRFFCAADSFPVADDLLTEIRFNNLVLDTVARTSAGKLSHWILSWSGCLDWRLRRLCVKCRSIPPNTEWIITAILSVFGLEIVGIRPNNIMISRQPELTRNFEMRRLSSLSFNKSVITRYLTRTQTMGLCVYASAHMRYIGSQRQELEPPSIRMKRIDILQRECSVYLTNIAFPHTRIKHRRAQKQNHRDTNNAFARLSCGCLRAARHTAYLMAKQ